MIFALYLNYFVRVFFFSNLKEFSEFRLLYISSLFLISSLFNFQGSFSGTPKLSFVRFEDPSWIPLTCLSLGLGAPRFFPFGIEHQTLYIKVLFLFSTPLSAECLAIISNTFTFVNTFLKVFLNFFQICAFFVKNTPFSFFFIHFD